MERRAVSLQQLSSLFVLSDADQVYIKDALISGLRYAFRLVITRAVVHRLTACMKCNYKRVLQLSAVIRQTGKREQRMPNVGYREDRYKRRDMKSA